MELCVCILVCVNQAALISREMWDINICIKKKFEQFNFC